MQLSQRQADESRRIGAGAAVLPEEDYDEEAAGRGGDGGGAVHPSAHKRMKRFVEYTKRVILFNLTLATPLFVHSTHTFAGHAWATICVKLLYATLSFVDLVAAVYLALVGVHERDRAPSGCDLHGILVYASAVLHMVLAYCRLLSLNGLYALLAVALAPLLFFVGSLFLKELRRGAGAGVEFPRGDGGEMSYADYDGKLKNLFDVSAAVNAIAGSAGLMGAVFGYSKSNNFSHAHYVSVSESLLFLTFIASQFVMLVTTARPRLLLPSSPPRLAGFLGHLVWSLEKLLYLSALFGAADFLGGLALLGFSLDFLELAFFFIAKFYSEEADRTNERRRDAEAERAGEGLADEQALLDSLQLLWLCVKYVYFSALVALYSEHAGKTDLGVFDRARVLLYFSAFCCCKLDGEGKLPPLPAVDAPRNRRSWWGLARFVVMGLAALDGLWRIVFSYTFLFSNHVGSAE